MLHAHLFRDLALFVEVAERRNFSKAAAALGMPISSLSRRIRALEEALGLRLIERTTRRFRLTRDGAIWFPQVARLVAETERTIAKIRTETPDEDVLTIALPNEPWAIESLARAMSSTDHACATRLHLDPRADLQNPPDVDIALFGDSTSPASGQSRSIGTVGSVLVAAPNYLARHGNPAHPDALSSHHLVLSGNQGMEISTLARAGERISQAASGAVAAGSASIAIRLAIAGLGIAVADFIAIEDDLQTGRLIRVLPDWELPARPVALALGGRSLSAQGRFLAEFLARGLEGAVAGTTVA